LLLVLLLLMMVAGVGMSQISLLIVMATARFGTGTEIVGGAGGAPRSRCELLVRWGAPVAKHIGEQELLLGRVVRD